MNKSYCHVSVSIFLSHVWIIRGGFVHKLVYSFTRQVHLWGFHSCDPCFHQMFGLGNFILMELALVQEKPKLGMSLKTQTGADTFFFHFYFIQSAKASYMV